MPEHVSNGAGSGSPAGGVGPDRPSGGTKEVTSLPVARRARRRLGMTSRLLLIHGLALSLVLGIVLLQVVSDFTSHYQTSMVTDLSEEVPEYVEAASLRLPGQSLEAFSRYYLQTHLLPAGHFVLIGLTRQPVLGSSGAESLASSPTVAHWLANPPRSSKLQTVYVGSIGYMVLTSPIQLAGRTIGVLVAGADLAPLNAARDQVAELAGIEAAIALVIALASAFLLLRRVLRTVGAVTKAAVEAREGELDRRLGDYGGDDEVGRLARTFDDMLDRISATVSAQRQLLSDVSHQLRTPLTVARGHLEVLRREGSYDPREVAEATGVVVDELAYMAALVDRLLLLGRSLEPDFIEPDDVDLRAFMADLFEAVRILDDRRWSLAPVPDAVIVADESKLRGALLNLVDNAVHATVPGDAIELRASCNGEVELAVSDTGRGIAPEMREAVFERFARPGASNERGAGLGLAIVKVVAEAHGGRVELVSRLGEGTTVTVVLPRASLRTEGPATSGASR